MANEEILVVDDEDDILELVSYSLSREGYRVSCATSSEAALDIMESNTPQLIVLDLMLPGMDGLELTRRLKSDPKTNDIPVVMLTAKSEEADIVIGLELGADDYVTKPFSPRVLAARVKAVLRGKAKEPPEEDSVVRIQELAVHRGRHRVLVNGKPVTLTLTEFGILDHLAAKPGWVFTRSEIIDAIHGQGYAVSDRSVDVQIWGIRKKLGHAGRHIEGVRGVGYRLKV